MKTLSFITDILFDSVLVGGGVILTISGIACYVADVSKHNE